MGFRVVTLTLDELASDPGSPVDGDVWYNTTADEVRARRNGATVALLTDLDHEAAANPHGTDLEDVRSVDNTVAGTIAMGSNKITGLATPTVSGDAAEFQWVIDQINSKLRGMDWQESVIDKDLVTAPGAPSTGDRYILAGIGGGWSGGAVNDIAEWDGAAWLFDTPNEGYATRVMDENKVYINDGSAWGLFEATLDHGSLLGLGDDDHTIYLLVDGTRAMGAALDMGGFAITNVGNVDGVDVSAHAALHERGGADEIDGDHLDIDFTPTNYTPSITPAEAANVDDLAAHLAGIDDSLGSGGGRTEKSGSVAAGSFSGNPKTATVTFGTAHGDANYAVSFATISSGDSFGISVQSKAAASFVINLGSNNVGDLVAVTWHADDYIDP